MASKEARSPFPRRAVLSDETYETIRNLIIDHEIPAGAKVNIEALSAQLNVSATPVREALARLESDGLIIKVALKGYTTTNLLTVKELTDLCQLALRLKDIDQVHGLTEHDARFHGLIAEIAGNKSVVESYQHTHCHLHLFRLYLATKNFEAANKGRKGFQKNLADQIHATLNAPATIKEHELIASAIAEGNGKVAKDAMNSHLKLSLKRYSTAARVLEK